jgi:CheY-like chemotaxis protein
VLVVDDNRDTTESLGLLLRLWGHDVRAAHDGPRALEAAKDYRPDVLLLDIGVPGFSGLEVAKRLRQDPAFGRTVIVAMTGYGQEEDRQRSREAGCNDHWVKPVDPAALEALLASLEVPREGAVPVA